MSLVIDTIRGVDKYLNGLLCLVIGKLAKPNKMVQRPKSPKNIVFVKLWAIGDSVITLPLIKQIKKKNPKAKITVIATKRNADVYKDQKFIDNIVLLSPEILGLANEFDVAFDLEPYLNSSAMLTRFIGKYTIGFTNQVRSDLYHEKTPFFKDKHMVDSYIEMGKSFGVKKVNKLEKLNVSKKDQKIVDSFLKKEGIKKTDLVIGICPGAAESSRQRMWPEKRFIELADNLITKYDAKIVFVGSPGELEQINVIRRKMRSRSSTTAGKLSLRQTFSFIEKCKIFISNDTGPMHIAAAQGVKTIGLFGPNTPARWGPYGEGNISLYHKTWCSPCIINEKGDMPDCFNKSFQKCMKLITVEEVEKAVNKLK
ncbi:MAG: glycosyltransferase family 9 protein [archaeon]